jgi:hypothetical protein
VRHNFLPNQLICQVVLWARLGTIRENLYKKNQCSASIKRGCRIHASWKPQALAGLALALTP